MTTTVATKEKAKARRAKKDAVNLTSAFSQKRT